MGSAATLLGVSTSSPFGGAVEKSPPVAETRQGKVRGVEVDGIAVFSGIPYGGATSGSARFLPPAKPSSWTGIRDATIVPPRCVQANGSVFASPIGDYFAGGHKDKLRLDEQHDSENCLYLNVLTAALGASKKVPVMIYIHGGGYTGGSGIIALAADAFPSEQNLVLVSVNHRLNAFGYLYLGQFSDQLADSGSVGMLDLVAALEWVRDNIAQFGGDARNITIFGESGGGAKISTLLAMPAAKGLFHKAIVESGSSLQGLTKEQGTETARLVLRKLGIPETHVERLQDTDAAALFAATQQTRPPSDGPRMRFGPVCDGRSVPEQTWNPKAPAISAGIPMIIGSCKDEATLFMGGKDQENFRLDWAGLPTQLTQTLHLSTENAERLIATYRGDLKGATASDIFFAIATDIMFRVNSITQADRKVDQGAAPVFMYLFTYDTPMEGGKFKAFHTADLPLELRLVKYSETEHLSRQLSSAWAAFARTGDPNVEGLPHWPRYQRKDRQTMTFNLETKVTSDPRGPERIVMQKLFPKGSAT